MPDWVGVPDIPCRYPVNLAGVPDGPCRGWEKWAGVPDTLIFFCLLFFHQEKKRRKEDQAPSLPVGAYCIRPPNGPDRGQTRRMRSRGEAPFVGRKSIRPTKWPRQGTDTGRRVPSLVPDGSSEGRMQYAPTAYRKKRPFLPIYLGVSRRKKEKGRPSAIPACRGVLNTPHRRSARIE